MARNKQRRRRKRESKTAGGNILLKINLCGKGCKKNCKLRPIAKGFDHRDNAAHVFISDTTSSQRVQAASVSYLYERASISAKALKRRRRRCNAKRKKQREKLLSCYLNESTSIDEAQLKCDCIVVDIFASPVLAWRSIPTNLTWWVHASTKTILYILSVFTWKVLLLGYGIITSPSLLNRRS